MLKQIPFLFSLSFPWILMDFRSPRRTLVGVQDYYNRKGLISNDGQKKKAFFVLQEYYQSLATTAPVTISLPPLSLGHQRYIKRTYLYDARSMMPNRKL